ncbi:MAG: hypothetical protein EOM06_01655 [Sphingobacteriia bacterium]|nr:hypothetical protein [Sphingobacteriia bacterium]
MKPVLLSLFVVLIAVLLITCEKPERNNPWDENNTLNPEAWAPQTLQIETTSITERQLTWTYNGPANIQGFKIDRKKGEEAWQVALAALPKETRTWNDTTLIPQTGLTYQYRIYTYAGNNSSAQKTTTTQTDFPAPSDLTLTKLSDISYKLEWKDNSTGEQGFKIDRKAIDNEWVIGYGK